MTLAFGSLFAGIGGMDLGLERAGMECQWQVEINPFCQRVLAKHWPHVARFSDVREVGSHNLERVDLICGGFPCQDISNAGKRAGIDGERSGLWSEYARIIRELQPRFVLVENVAALLARGLGRVLGDLAASGYDAEWDCIPAAAVGAPHRRDRLFLVAYASGEPERAQPLIFARSGDSSISGADGADGALADADGRGLAGLAERDFRPEAREQASLGGDALRCDSDVADAESLGRGTGRAGRPAGDGEGATSAWLPDVADAHNPGCSQQRRAIAALAEFAAAQRGGWWSSEPNVGRVAHGIPSRVDRLRGLGNAVVPQVAEFLGRRIVEVAR